MELVIWYSKLKPGVTPEAYEKWARDFDYKHARQIPSIISYRIFRADSTFDGNAITDHDYVEIVEITSLDAYRKDIASHPSAQAVISQIGDYIESSGSLAGTPIPE
jgi:hypothetical protein